MRFAFIIPGIMCVIAANAADSLSGAIENVRAACGGISNELGDMKTKAGINTAVTGVGTVAGGVALGTGIAKSGVDAEIADLESEIERLRAANANTPVEQITIADPVTFNRDLGNFVATYSAQLQKRESELSELEQKSKTLGNWRTGMMATSTATNIAGAMVANTNKIRGDLKTTINECLASVKTLSNVRMQARIEKSATDAELQRAERIVSACDAWSTVDIDVINRRASGAATSAGVGAGLGIAGTITSASANSDATRGGDDTREKKLNTAANVLAGATTAASATATIFNATQISAIKRAATVADECEEALR